MHFTWRRFAMTQLTVRGIDPHLHDALKREAQRQGQSVNKYVLDLLREALGLNASPAHSEYDDLDHLAGTRAGLFGRLKHKINCSIKIACFRQIICST